MQTNCVRYYMNFERARHELMLTPPTRPCTPAPCRISVCATT